MRVGWRGVIVLSYVRFEAKWKVYHLENIKNKEIENITVAKNRLENE